MALVNSNQFGASFSWGFQASDAPVITNFFPRQAELRWEAEVFSVATNGEGHAESIVTSKPGNRKITGTFTGYIASGFDSSAIAANFTFLTRFFIVRNIGEPRRKGEYVEVSLEAESYSLVTTGPN